MPQHTYTLYLAKEQVEDFYQLLSENGKRRIEDPNSIIVDSSNFGEGAKLIMISSGPRTPAWMTELMTVFDIESKTSHSICALLMFRAENRIFIVSFSHGWMYLDERYLESDFGLRVALNALDETQLKRVELANLGDALRGTSSSPYRREFLSFKVDEALDIVRKVSGATNELTSLDQITGAQSAKISGSFSLSDLPSKANEIINSMNSEAYEQTSFRLVDVIRPIKDRELRTELDLQIAEEIREGDMSFELSLPIVGEDESVGYKFVGPGLKGYFPDLLFRNYLNALGTRRSNYPVGNLKKHKIVGVFEDRTKPPIKWNIHKALVGSLVNNGVRYALNEGEWYNVDDQFRESVDNSFQEITGEWETGLRMPVILERHSNDGGMYQDEAEFNSELAQTYEFVLMDKKLISVKNTPISQLEACDLLDIEGKRFIHVKRSSRRSSVLSHFFKQGSNAAQYFKKYQAMWDALVNVVIKNYGEVVGGKLLNAIQDRKPWTVEYWILDSPRVSGIYTIPFFSKISLQDEARNLRAMNYRVTLRFIHLEPQNI